MYRTDDILDRLNNRNKKSKAQTSDDTPAITLSDIMVRSFPELRTLADNALTWGEAHFLYEQAQEALKENKITESRILSRANPQLANAVHLGIKSAAQQFSFDEMFGQRASQFVRPGAVSSMFSPAAYLTELYREARELHPAASPFNIDARRPDLASLALSQDNMDNELSTLSMSNDILLNNIQAAESLDYDGVMEKLSTFRHTGVTPFSLPYEATRQSILLQDEDLTAFWRNPYVSKHMDASSLLAIQANIAPELYQILTENVTLENAKALAKKNFGEMNTILFNNPAFIARYYSLTHDELTSLFGFSFPNRVELSPSRSGVEKFVDDQLIALIEHDGTDNEWFLVNRTYNTQNRYQLNYAELIPQGNQKYLFNFSVTDNRGPGSFALGTTGHNSNDLFYQDDFTFVKNTPISIPITLTDEQIKKPVAIGISRMNGGYFYTVHFTITHYYVDTFALSLNKIIRLYKATKITPADLRTVIESVNSNLVIDNNVLEILFYVRHYMQRYRLNVHQAMVLSNAAISQVSIDRQPSAFDRLFNTPLLDNRRFPADGAVLNLNSTLSVDASPLAILKRAFQVSNTELSTLWALAAGDEQAVFNCSIENLSALYRVRMLAQVHDLSVTELSLLLSVSPYAGKHIAKITRQELAELVNFLERSTLWLNEQTWTVSDVFLMTTERYSTLMTPDIESLISTLNNGLANQMLETEAQLISATAPLIAAATQLDSAEATQALLLWLEQLKPQGLGLRGFLALVANENRSPEETASLVAFCQVLGQLSLMVRSTGISHSELLLMVTQPAVFEPGITTLPHNLATLYGLTCFHRQLGLCGALATDVLTALGTQKLDTDLLARALTLDIQSLNQAAEQVSPDARTINSWQQMDAVLQWLDMAQTMGITPEGVARLVAVKYGDQTTSPSYGDWAAISQSLQAGLDVRQTAALHAQLDEAISTALSAYCIQILPFRGVTDRDTLYSHLLIDNQVSAQVNTTRLAQAIASLQMYVNRALAGADGGVDNGVKSRPFFTDWDRYNKRYSTWAGVSTLAYYPENYIDPTMRLGQTGMMEEMLQSLSQSQLTEDTVESAFKTYMTRFEEIANLDVVSGYHNSPSAETGSSYLVGKSAAGEYYWRSVDLAMLSAGKLPANAWSEWKKISTAISSFNDLIRPVIFQSRLYIVWLESHEAGTTSDKTTFTAEYTLKYAHILHDGSWSTPVSVPMEGNLPGGDMPTVGMYCASEWDGDKLYILFYQKQANYIAAPTEIVGVNLLFDGSAEQIPTQPAKEIATYIYSQLDTAGAKRLNSPYTGGETMVTASGVNLRSSIWSPDYYTILSRGGIFDIVATINQDASGNPIVNLDCRAQASILHIGESEAAVSRVDVMKRFGKIGDKFAIFSFNESLSSALFGQKNEFATVIAPLLTNTSLQEIYLSSRTSGLAELVLVYSDPHYSELVEFTIQSGFTRVTAPDPEMQNSLLESIVIAIEQDTMWASFDSNIDTGISTSNVRLTLTAGRNTHEYNNSSCLKYTFDESLYLFENVSLAIPVSDFNQNRLDVSVVFNATADDGRRLGQETLLFTLTAVANSNIPIISLTSSGEKAQYLQIGPHRIRLNTLFAQQLVARANYGINSVLSMESQLLPEPSMGHGGYIRVRLPRYNATTHGASRNARISLWRGMPSEGEAGYYDVWQGTLLDIEQSITLFIPLSRLEIPFFHIINFPYSLSTGLGLYLTCDNGRMKAGTLSTANSAGQLQLTRFTAQDHKAFDVVMLGGHFEEPMDFNGANALYFWEMFYYVPMMVFQRLLQEQRFDEATRWIKYVWRPEGFMVNGAPASFTWNVRPLEEDLSWNSRPLDAVDPDAVAQSDPMHYKVATFMGMLDLLIARGDAAYRQLERDTLSEAQMWYVQALSLLGDEPYRNENTGWSAPRLDAAASKVTQANVQQALLAVREQLTASASLKNANSLTALFLPQQNEKLQGYWRTLAQRLFNLRHHLSIDGQPLSLPVYAHSADPVALLSAAVFSAQGGSSLPSTVMPSYRFPIMLESARTLVNQLTQFGNTLLSFTERQDAQAMSELLLTQGSALTLQSVALQDCDIVALKADAIALQESREGALSRVNSYRSLYEENVNRGETQAMDLYLSSSVISASSTVLHMAGAALDLAPNIFGLANGGMRYGALFNASAIGMELAASGTRIAADRLSQSEAYRRRRQEWEIQRNAAESDVKLIDAQLASLAVRRESAALQKTYLETQHAQTQSQLAFLQNTFSNTALYHWLRGKLSAIYYQFYDLTVSRCLMAQQAYQWDSSNSAASFIRPGAWQGTYAGLLAGETLMLNLSQMEQSYLENDVREREVTRTVSLSEVYAGLTGEQAFTLADKVTELVNAGTGSVGSADNGLTVRDKQLQATVTLSDLGIHSDYPASLGNTRRIKQVSVTLPALVGPYQDVRAVLEYGGSVVLPRGCRSLAVSHGMNDSGQFQLDFNDARYLPFEGIPVADSGTFTLTFPDADNRQKLLLLSLSDIILHIRYTIR
ncbi:insecticidal toxin complex protein A [Shewanella sp. DC2-4]|uniref:Tc toxin subunit A-related protein n=1 Tax=Shewanella sp. DC2-4 TaxID=2739431 RepID=UPI00156743D2|nr:neuraminidase-like domain-containing protein [Shewanella sp. DC2-4]NRD30251.1 insecticidal toxin complex protein A [Shewanella sp. DC2-4]